MLLIYFKRDYTMEKLSEYLGKKDVSDYVNQLRNLNLLIHSFNIIKIVIQASTAIQESLKFFSSLRNHESFHYGIIKTQPLKHKRQILTINIDLGKTFLDH